MCLSIFDYFHVLINTSLKFTIFSCLFHFTLSRGQKRQQNTDIKKLPAKWPGA